MKYETKRLLDLAKAKHRSKHISISLLHVPNLHRLDSCLVHQEESDMRSKESSSENHVESGTRFSEKKI